MNYSRRVHFYETDQMGIVHHSNYIRFFEEARVFWAQTHGLIQYENPQSASRFTVLEYLVQHKKSLLFGDLFEVEMRVKLEKVKIIFEYRMSCPERAHEVVSLARTVHIPLDSNRKVLRPSPEIIKIMEDQSLWKEIWL